MKFVATIRSTQTREIEIDAATYGEAHDSVQVPDGWALVSIRDASEDH